MENSMEVSQKTRVAIWSSNPTPGYISEKTLIGKDTCIPMFTAALFTIAKTWKQAKCPSTDEWTKKMCYTLIYTHNGILFRHKKEWNNAICSNMDGPRDYHTKWSQRKTNIIWYCLYVESLKMMQINLFTKQKQTQKHGK